MCQYYTYTCWDFTSKYMLNSKIHIAQQLKQWDSLVQWISIYDSACSLDGIQGHL